MKNEGRILRTSISSGIHGFAGSGMMCGGRATCTLWEAGRSPMGWRVGAEEGCQGRALSQEKAALTFFFFFFN